MRVFQEPERGGWEKELASLTIGTLSGLALGALISRVLPPRHRLGEALRRAPTGIRGRLRPAPLRRLTAEQAALDQLENTVLQRFLTDPVLRDRGIDIGAISPGIIELSGSVWTEEEAHRAVSLANGIAGVSTVVNRLEIEELARRRSTRRAGSAGEFDESFGRLGGVGGMGRRRQGDTEPDRRDDSRHMQERALAAADQDQLDDEGFIRSAAAASRPDPEALERTRYPEDQLDNQDPHGKHARLTLDAPAQELNTQARVGESPKPGTALRLERSGSETPSDRSPGPRD